MILQNLCKQGHLIKFEAIQFCKPTLSDPVSEQSRYSVACGCLHLTCEMFHMYVEFFLLKYLFLISPQIMMIIGVLVDSRCSRALLIVK